jgi:hypothetical protein
MFMTMVYQHNGYFFAHYKLSYFLFEILRRLHSDCPLITKFTLLRPINRGNQETEASSSERAQQSRNFTQQWRPGLPAQTFCLSQSWPLQLPASEDLDRLKGTVTPVLNYIVKNYSMKAYGKWKHSSTILDLGTRWRWTVRFTPMLLSSWG